MTDWTAGEGMAPRHSPIRLGRAGRPSLASRALHRDSPLRRIDYVLAVAVLVLCVLGTTLVYYATKNKELAIGADPRYFLKRNVLNIGIGLGLAVISAFIDYRALRAYAPIVYIVSVIGLMAVLVIGVTINGAHSWIRLPGGFEQQPSEYAKVALVIGSAMILSERRDGERAPRSSDVLLVLGFAAIPLGLIMLQPDFGTTMVFVFTILGMLAVSGVSSKWVAGLVAAGVLAGTLILTTGVLAPYQKARLTSFTQGDTKATTQVARTTLYNVNQAKTAIGNGGLTGQGLGHGTQTNSGFVPEQQTDFIFTTAGEELGFVGSALLVLLLGTILWRGLRIAQRAEDMFGVVLAAGIVTWFAFQMFVNIGMTLGIMPVTGLPLPFISYGGSSMMANMMAIGLLQNVNLRTRTTP
ncbi:MAG TPA: rod shape-determining protein RodA [Mycobacteriales bacterium]|nr:rod shape-determining protein RodA [Mycobacteriales bacterium]